MLSVGKYRNLSQCSDDNQTFSIMAIDHRPNENEMNKNGLGPKTYADVVAFKNRVIRNLAPAATAILADPDYSMTAMINGDLPGNVGFLAPLELTNYSRTLSDRGMDLLPDWGVDKLKQAGFNGAKLYMNFHPDAPNTAQKTDAVDAIIEQCDKHQIPFFFEPISYSLDPDTPLTNEERRQVVIESARHFTQRGVDILKLEFPIDCNIEPDIQVWQDATQELDAVCTVPWALLSAGVSYDLFIQQAEVACAAGASGVIAGRAIWGEVVAMPVEEQDEWLQTVGRDRMERLTAVCRGMGHSWQTRHEAPVVTARWYA